MANIVLMPTTPSSVDIPGPLSEGKSIVVKGCVPKRHDSVAINLIRKADETIALHFNPRFNENCIVRNTLASGQWGPEEKQGAFTLLKDVEFEIAIKVHKSHYQILVNGKDFCEYKHRIPFDEVGKLAVTEGITVTSIEFNGFSQGIFANGPGGNIGFDRYTPQSTPPMYKPAVPLSTRMPFALFPGMLISVSGVPHPNCLRFTVNLCRSGTEDIAFHFDVRVNLPNNKNQIIRNHKVNDAWGEEETAIPYFPFIPSASFDILILCDSEYFKIAVNNQHFTEFKHRIMPPAGVDTLEVTGDVRLNMIRFQ